MQFLRRPAGLAALLGAGLLVSTTHAADGYVPPALVRIHHTGTPAASIEAVLEAGGEVIQRQRGWFDALLPSDLAQSEGAFAGLAEGDRGEVLEADIDRQLDRFRGVEDVGVYHTIAEVQSEITELAAAHPDVMTVEVIGKSFEGRDIHAVRIGPAGDGRPTFLICGMHHSREWISVEVPMGLIHQLVEGYDQDASIKELVDSREVWVVPVLNPDGLEYSQTEYKMWRKNRRHNPDGSYGVDLNRNWGYMWGGQGASPSPGSDTFRGAEAFSEPELQALRDLALREQPVASLSFHSYSELVLWPWSYDYDHAPDEDVMMLHGRKMAALNGYTAEKSTDLYPSSGDFDDWFYGTLGALSFTIELGKQFVPSQGEVPGIVAANLKALDYYLRNCADPFPLMVHTALGATTDPDGPYPAQLQLARRYQADDPVASAAVVYSTPGMTGTTRSALVKGDEGLYAGEIPGSGLGTVEYHFEVTELDGRTHRIPKQGEHGFQVVDQLYLLVDDDQGKPYEAAYAAALEAAGVPFRVSGSEGLAAGDLLGASGVIWFCGDDSSTALTDGEQALLKGYLDQGGELLLFGQDIGYALKGKPFYTQVMKARFVKDTSGSEALSGVAGGFLDGLALTINQGQGVAQRYPEAIEPREGATALLAWQGADSQGAVAVDGGYRLAYFGVGLEGIDGGAARAEVLKRGLAWIAEHGAARGLRRAEALRALGPGAASPRALARLEAGVLDAVRQLGRRGDRGALEALLGGATEATRRSLARTFRQAERHLGAR